MRNLLGLEEESRGRDCTTGFGYGLWISREILHCLANLVFGDRDDVVDIGTDVLEVDRTDALGAQPVSDRARNLLGGKLDDLAPAQAGLAVGGEFGFYSDYFDFGIGQLDGSGDP